MCAPRGVHIHKCRVVLLGTCRSRHGDHNGDLIDKANMIMKLVEENYPNRFSYELLLSEIESNTTVCDNVNESISELRKNRLLLNEIGKSNDLLLV